MASFSVVNNIASQNAQSNLAMTSIGLNKALGRLSSGFRINNSGDDAAGMAVANTYRTKHIRLARWTFPIWLYVSVTGVIIYVMLYHLWPPAAG